jgi:ammonia channel protein AmtB
MQMIVLLGAAVLLVRVGQALYVAGLCRSKNAAGMTLRLAADLCAGVLAFWAAGVAILFQRTSGVFGVEWGLLFGATPAKVEHFFYACVVLVATGAVTGTLAERSKFSAAWAAAVVMAALVVPVAARWAWGGWLARLGFRDVAGAAAVHLSAGAFAAVGAALVGPRTGKYNRDGSANMIPGHNLPLAGAGVLVMLAGWVPYVYGCALQGGQPSGVEPFNVLLAAAAAGAAAMALAQVRHGKPDVVLALTGVLGGLVSVTAAGGAVGTESAVIIGALAGLIVPTVAWRSTCSPTSTTRPPASRSTASAGCGGPSPPACSPPRISSPASSPWASRRWAPPRWSRWPRRCHWPSSRRCAPRSACASARPTSTTAWTWPSTTSAPTPTSSRP